MIYRQVNQYLMSERTRSGHRINRNARRAFKKSGPFPFFTTHHYYKDVGDN